MPSRFGSLTLWSVAALVGGMALGLAGHASGHPGFHSVGTAFDAIGSLWLAALQLLTLPLAIVLVLAAISSASARSVGGLTVKAMLCFAAAMILGGVLTVPIAQAALRSYAVAPETVAALSASITVPAGAAAAAANPAGWLDTILPPNLFQAAVAGQIFPLLLFAMAFALAVTRLPEASRRLLADPFRALADAMLTLVRWILVITPLGVLALAYVLALETGASLAGVLGAYLLLQPAVTVLWLLLLYPVTALLGRVSPGRFARAVLPAQLIAATTRSSVASMPALVEGARLHLALPDTGARFLIPLSVSLFRPSVAVQDAVKLAFLAHIYGVALAPVTIAIFVVTVCVFSFSSTGTPSSGGAAGFKMIPVYAAAGIPIEGIILLEVVETIPDIFATVLNVTGQMSAATILSPREPRAA
jgi:Na+/H+-dicarboxylate symporter